MEKPKVTCMNGIWNVNVVVRGWRLSFGCMWGCRLKYDWFHWRSYTAVPGFIMRVFGLDLNVRPVDTLERIVAIHRAQQEIVKFAQ